MLMVVESWFQCAAAMVYCQQDRADRLGILVCEDDALAMGAVDVPALSRFAGKNHGSRKCLIIHLLLHQNQ